MGLFGKAPDKPSWRRAVASVLEVWLMAEGANIVQGSGYFTVAGEYYTVLVDEEFRSAREAEAWVARMEASPRLAVRYNPNDPSENVIDE